jgi:hypothetical protein
VDLGIGIGGIGRTRREDAMWFRIFMIVGVIVVAGGWVVYGIYDYKMRQEEKKQPKPRSEKLQKTQTEVSDWAKQMAAFKKPVAKRQARGDQDDDA